MEDSQCESDSKLRKRPSLLRHNRTASDLDKVDNKDRPVSETSNGLRAVSSVTGAIHSFFKWSASPLAKEKKARSCDSLPRSASAASLSSILSTDSNKMDKRRSSSNVLPKTPSPSHTPKDGSPDVSLRDGKEPSVSASASFSKREGSPAVAFSISDTSQGKERGSISDGANSTGFRTPSRKSTDSGDSVKVDGASLDIQQKSFENSLDTILTKCSETSLDGTTDKGDDSTLKAGKSDRKKKSTPWYTMLSPTYKSRSEDFKRQFKDIPQDERLIVDYSCALQKEILVHGRMFVTQNWICFYANIFRWETIVTIPTKEICAITKEKTARVIPNAIQITTEKEKCFFTSFTARDKTFMMLFRLWQNALMEQPMLPQELWHWVHSSYGDELGLTSSDDDYVPPPSVSDSKDLSVKDSNMISKGDSSDVQLTSDPLNAADDSTQADISLDDSASAAVNVKAPDNKDLTDYSDTTEDDEDEVLAADMPTLCDQCGPRSDGEVVCSDHDHLARLAHNEVYQVPVDKLFELMFTDTEFFRHFTSARKYQDVIMSPWRDHPDENIGRVRELDYTIPLNAPFGPKSSHTIEKHLCYKQSKPGVLYVIDAECTPMGIPYSDAFYVVNRYCLTRVTKQKCRLRVTSEVKYRKSVWGVVKNMIERNSTQGVLDYFQCLGTHLRRESEKQQKIQGVPTAKRKLRKRRAHGIRSSNPPSDLPSTSRQLSRSHTAEKMIAPPTPVRNMIAAQKEEKLLKMNADTLVRIVCFILVLLVMFNALLFYKLWSLEMTANVLYFPHSEETVASFLKHPPQTQEEWVHLLNQQQRLHEAEMGKWKEILSVSISLIDQMKKTLLDLKDIIDGKNVPSPSKPS